MGHLLSQMFWRSVYLTETLMRIVHRICLFAFVLPLLWKVISDIWPQRLRYTIRDTHNLGAWLEKNRRTFKGERVCA